MTVGLDHQFLAKVCLAFLNGKNTAPVRLETSIISHWSGAKRYVLTGVDWRYGFTIDRFGGVSDTTGVTNERAMRRDLVTLKLSGDLWCN